MDLLDLLKRPEGKTLEFKRDLSSPDGALKTLVGFANTAGGTLILGVEGRTARVRGVQNALEVEERMASLISDSITPRLRSRIVGGVRVAPRAYSHPSKWYSSVHAPRCRSVDGVGRAMSRGLGLPARIGRLAESHQRARAAPGFVSPISH